MYNYVLASIMDFLVGEVTRLLCLTSQLLRRKALVCGLNTKTWHWTHLFQGIKPLFFPYRIVSEIEDYLILKAALGQQCYAFHPTLLTPQSEPARRNKSFDLEERSVVIDMGFMSLKGCIEQ